MSWGTTANDLAEDDVQEKLNKSFATNYPEASAKMTEQFEAAKEAVSSLMDSGAISGEKFNVSCGGHANNKEKTDSPDYVSVNVTTSTV